MYGAAVVQQRRAGGRRQGPLGAELRGLAEKGRRRRRRLSPQAAAGEGKGAGAEGKRGPLARAPPLGVYLSGAQGTVGRSRASPHLTLPAPSLHIPPPSPPRGRAARACPAAVGPQRGDGAGASNSNGGGRRAAVTSTPRARGARRESPTGGGGGGARKARGAPAHAQSWAAGWGRGGGKRLLRSSPGSCEAVGERSAAVGSAVPVHWWPRALRAGRSSPRSSLLSGVDPALRPEVAAAGIRWQRVATSPTAPHGWFCVWVFFLIRLINFIFLPAAVLQNLGEILPPLAYFTLISAGPGGKLVVFRETCHLPMRPSEGRWGNEAVLSRPSCNRSVLLNAKVNSQ